MLFFIFFLALKGALRGTHREQEAERLERKLNTLYVPAGLTSALFFLSNVYEKIIWSLRRLFQQETLPPSHTQNREKTKQKRLFYWSPPPLHPLTLCIPSLLHTLHTLPGHGGNKQMRVLHVGPDSTHATTINRNGTLL